MFSADTAFIRWYNSLAQHWFRCWWKIRASPNEVTRQMDTRDCKIFMKSWFLITVFFYRSIKKQSTAFATLGDARMFVLIMKHGFAYWDEECELTSPEFLLWQIFFCTFDTTFFLTLWQSRISSKLKGDILYVGIIFLFSRRRRQYTYAMLRTLVNLRYPVPCPNQIIIEGLRNNEYR